MLLPALLACLLIGAQGQVTPPQASQPVASRLPSSAPRPPTPAPRAAPPAPLLPTLTVDPPFRQNASSVAKAPSPTQTSNTSLAAESLGPSTCSQVPAAVTFCQDVGNVSCASTTEGKKRHVITTPGASCSQSQSCNSTSVCATLSTAGSPNFCFRVAPTRCQAAGPAPAQARTAPSPSPPRRAPTLAPASPRLPPSPSPPRRAPAPSPTQTRQLPTIPPPSVAPAPAPGEALIASEEPVPEPATTLAPAAAELLQLSRADPVAGFEKYLSMYNETGVEITNSPERLENFKKSLEFINQRQTNDSSLLQLGPFAALSKDEFDRMLGLLPGNNTEDPAGEERWQVTQITAPGPTPAGRRLLQFSEPTVRVTQANSFKSIVPPVAIDWRQKGRVGEIKHQGNCGSCWAFSSVAAVESAIAIQSKSAPPNLSERQLVDCDQNSGGCVDGSFQTALEYIANSSISTAANLPYPDSMYYDAQKGTCPATEGLTPKYSISGYGSVPFSQKTLPRGLPESEYLLMKAVSRQPVIIGMRVEESFKFFGGGVLECPENPPELFHAVTVVGYKAKTIRTIKGLSVAPGGYWIVRNSFGKEWGEKGYFHLAMGNRGPKGACNIFDDTPIFPLAKGNPAIQESAG